jgi:hypothetical protein
MSSEFGENSKQQTKSFWSWVFGAQNLFGICHFSFSSELGVLREFFFYSEL